MEQSRYRTYTDIDLSALRHNFAVVRSRVAPGCKILSVIKADAYGHGAAEAAKAFCDSDFFGVACLDEALILRESGVSKPILILGYTSPLEVQKLVRYQLTQCAFSAEYLTDLQNGLSAGQRLKVHLKIDTGMSRLGFYAHDEASARGAAEEIAALRPATPNLDYEGIFTHFTSSEADPGQTARQFACFSQTIDALKEKGITFALRHCANSAATLLYPEYHLDMVRPGIILYGYLPDRNMPDFHLRPAMELKSYVAQVHHLQPGDTVSYNCTFRADKPTDIAAVCIGYADGLQRSLSNGAPILINGKRTRILGRICMDQCLIDVTGIPVRSGDRAVLIGTSGAETITAEDLAEFAGTIPYEILCNIGKRIPRFYHGE